MLKFGNTYLNFGGTYLRGWTAQSYNTILQQSEGGIIGATPLTGYKDTEVTLSNTPSKDYVFSGYEISGSNLYDINKFKFVDGDVTAIGKFKYYPEEIPLNNQLWTRPLSYNDGGSGISIKNLYGRDVGYYTIDAAKRIESIYSASGWRIPSTKDFEKLYANIGATFKQYLGGGGYRPAGTYLKSETNWGSGNGIDKFGFDIKPLGYMNNPSASITNLGFDFTCWGSTVSYEDDLR